MKEKILRVLKQKESFVSGEELSNQLGVSRTAIWKNIAKLKEEGYTIESVTRKGYRLVDSPDCLSKEEIRYRLTTKELGKEIITHKTIDSTNIAVKEIARQGAVHGTVVFAEEQTMGKGRKGRIWQSPAGDNIYMSCLLRPDLSPMQAPMLTLVAGLAVCEAIEETTGLQAGIKWPNDVVLGKKKVCGILTEMSAEMEQLHYVILGIGINVNQEVFNEEIVDMATSLKLETGEDISRVDLINTLLHKLEHYYAIFVQDGDLRNIVSKYKEKSVTYGSHVRVSMTREELLGQVVDINDQGELILQHDEQRSVIRSGEVSVRGLYGYV